MSEYYIMTTDTDSLLAGWYWAKFDSPDNVWECCEYWDRRWLRDLGVLAEVGPRIPTPAELSDAKGRMLAALVEIARLREQVRQYEHTIAVLSEK